MKTPHKHAELIKDWADGAEIEVSMDGSHWSDCRDAPAFNVNFNYRIKPEPRPDIVRYGIATHWWGREVAEFGDNIKTTFDGETGKLKSVEVIS